jgi:TPR repeat protein
MIRMLVYLAVQTAPAHAGAQRYVLSRGNLPATCETTDNDEFLEGLRKAASHGEIEAMFVLGESIRGLGDEALASEGLVWLRRAAEFGHVCVR